MKKNTSKSVDVYGNGHSTKATNETPQKGSKQDVNLRKNSFLHFQIGLILAMLMVYAGLEASFAMRGEEDFNGHDDNIAEITEYHPELNKKIKIEKTKTKKIKVAKKVANPDKIKIVDELEPDIVEVVIDTPDDSLDNDFDAGSIPVTDDSPVIDDVPFILIEDVPVFPGCEKAKNKRLCFNESMKKHIRKNFRYPTLEKEMGVQGRVDVMFKIDVDGSITGLQMRGPAKGLEKEAARIMNKLPKMTPGKQRGRAVRVPFSIPINFKLN